MWLELGLRARRCRSSAASHDPERRLALLDAGGIDAAVISISTPVGVESLPEDEARPLLDAYHGGISELVDRSNGRLRAFAAACLNAADAGAGDVADRLRGGIRRPVAAERGAGDAGRARPLRAAARAARAGGTAAVRASRAGSVDAARAGRPAPAGVVDAARPVPGLVAARVRDVAGAGGAAPIPTLRVVFAIMAGGAPFLEGRWRTFSGLAGAIDRNVFLDTASCQRLDLELALAAYGAEQIVLGTDIPVIDPEPLLRSLDALGPAVFEAVAERNPARVFHDQGGVP